MELRRNLWRFSCVPVPVRLRRGFSKPCTHPVERLCLYSIFRRVEAQGLRSIFAEMMRLRHRRRLERLRWLSAAWLCAALLAWPAGAEQAPPQDAIALGRTQLDRGYADMYNLQFPQAHAAFAAWMQAHPADPMGPVSDAAAYLFTEFARLHVLDIDLFDNDNHFESRGRRAADPEVRTAFDRDLEQADHLAKGTLAQAPRDANALFAETLVNGLHADYVQMIEGRDLAGLHYTRIASKNAERLLAVAPDMDDAYLAVGLENYILGLKPAPVRWLLSLTGAETNAALGRRDMELAAAHGHYLAPFARLLLAVAALRDKDKPKARQILASLAAEFPGNPLYARQLAKIQ
jgi:hypothetical protein